MSGKEKKSPASKQKHKTCFIYGHQYKAGLGLCVGFFVILNSRRQGNNNISREC